MKDRGLAGEDSVVLSGLVPDGEFRALLVHEVVGHVFDLGCLVGNPQSGASAFRDGKKIMWNDDPSIEYYQISWLNERTKQTTARPSHFLSRYAHDSDVYEDIAEGAVMYVLHNELFRKRASENPVIAAKLAWFEKYLPLPESPEPLSRSLAVWDSTKGPSWDATKLPYVWHSEGLRIAQK
jgi:hypothetical protein